jgi:phosphoglycerate dehydrogenase-like enzyme
LNQRCVSPAGNAETQKLIGAPELALMQESSVLINISRGSIVDWPEVRKRTSIIFCDAIAYQN